MMQKAKAENVGGGGWDLQAPKNKTVFEKINNVYFTFNASHVHIVQYCNIRAFLFVL